MTTYIRPAASARDESEIITGWNISPNTSYVIRLAVSATYAVVLLASSDGLTVHGTAGVSTGTDQPVVFTPAAGATVGMADAALGWHMLLTTDGTEGDRTITMDPMVDLAARTHPVYVDEGLALFAATADIDAGTHYTSDVVVSCPRGIGAALGDIASVPVDADTCSGQIEAVTWSGTPDGTSAVVTIRQHTPLTPEAYVAPSPPPSANDVSASTNAATAITGNVLDGISGCVVSAVNDFSANVGEDIVGSSGGVFVIESDGVWSFDPGADFDDLASGSTLLTSVSFHVSDGSAERGATLSVTVASSAIGVSIVGTVVAKNTTGAVTMSMPEGLLPGDYVFVISGVGTSVDYNYTRSGYTLVKDVYGNGSSQDSNLGVLYKKMGDPVDASFTSYNTINIYHGAITILVAVRGVDADDPLDVAATWLSVASTVSSLYFPAISPLSDRSYVLACASGTSSVDLSAVETSVPGFELIQKQSYRPISHATHLGIAGKEWRTGDSAIASDYFRNLVTTTGGYSRTGITLVLKAAR